jgi:hypothetical protein
MRVLLHEHGLPLLVAKAGDIAVVGPVEKFAALVWPITSKKITLVVVVEVNG